jgi:hypothetical protein
MKRPARDAKIRSVAPATKPTTTSCDRHPSASIGHPPLLRTFVERRRAFLVRALSLARARSQQDCEPDVFEWTSEGTDDFLGHGASTLRSRSPIGVRRSANVEIRPLQMPKREAKAPKLAWGGTERVRSATRHRLAAPCGPRLLSQIALEPSAERRTKCRDEARRNRVETREAIQLG